MQCYLRPLLYCHPFYLLRAFRAAHTRAIDATETGRRLRMQSVRLLRLVRMLEDPHVSSVGVSVMRLLLTTGMAVISRCTPGFVTRTATIAVSMSGRACSALEMLKLATPARERISMTASTGSWSARRPLARKLAMFPWTKMRTIFRKSTWYECSVSNDHRGPCARIHARFLTRCGG